MNSQEPWHTLSEQEALSALDSMVGGLSDREATKRLAEFGLNQIQTGGQVSGWRILIEQLRNILIIILLLATLMSGFLGHTIESLAIAVIVSFAIGLGFIQEYRAQNAMQALRNLAVPNAKVVRAGSEVKISSEFVVPGDIVVLKMGDRVPADARLLESVNLTVDEASLTGESVTVGKQVAALTSSSMAVADRNNLVYS
ncbi:MAG: HAD-IC family P-type ATPase, partial [bacterium]